MQYPIQLNIMCESLRPSQSDIRMLRELELINYVNVRSNIYCMELPKPPVKTQLPIFQMHHATNLRNDCGDVIWIANHWRLVPTLRHLQQAGVRGPKYQWVDSPSYLYPHERHNFLRILESYRSEFPIISGAGKYREDLEKLGCVVNEVVIDNYDHEQITKFVDCHINGVN